MGNSSTILDSMSESITRFEDEVDIPASLAILERYSHSTSFFKILSRRSSRILIRTVFPKIFVRMNFFNSGNPRNIINLLIFFYFYILIILNNNGNALGNYWQ